jgi:epoxyqueuosine reductase
MSLTQRILGRAHELGFALADIAPAIRLPHAERFEAWLEEGYHGSLGYMAEHAALRVDPRGVMPEAQTVISVGMLYGSPEGGHVARYARNADYHDVMRSKLASLAAFVRAEAGGRAKTRSCVDSAPLMERDVALLAGLGWLGKSSCVIHPKLGSYLLLGELCVDLDLEVNSRVHPDRCGTCSRCIDACPTGAIIAPYVVDARRCIAYLTIELQGAIPRPLRALIGDKLFGCDICQEVCPWNRKAPPTPHAAFAPRADLQDLSVAGLLELDEARFRARFRRSPLWRSHREGLVRNACVVLGNSGDVAAVAPLTQALTHDPSPVVRGHAAWALGRFLPHPVAEAALRAASVRELDPDVLEELRAATDSLAAVTGQ